MQVWRLTLACSLLCHASFAREESLPPQRLNVLFIAVDDLRPDLGCYGDPIVQSPNLDRLAGDGLLLNRAYCQQAVCSPSRTSLLTGARPDSTRVYDLTTHFRREMPEVITLPQHFKDHGYFTQGMGKIYHSGLDDRRSWSAPSLNPAAPFGRPPQTTRPGASKPEVRGPATGIVDVDDNTLHDGQLTELAIDALRASALKPGPFFLAVGYVRPHLPFIAPRKYWDLYDRAEIPLAPNPFYPKGAPPYAVRRGPTEVGSYQGPHQEGPIDDDYARQLKHGYFASVSFVDAQVGLLLDELDRLGLKESTIVVVWGDHGWKLGEHDAWAKHSNVENDTRVPLIISAPSMKQKGTRSDALVELVDVYPTLADIAGLPLPEHLEGKSFAPLLDDPSLSWKQAAFSQFPRQSGGKRLMGYSMRTPRYRLTRWVEAEDHSKVAAVELYDHHVDPQENTNIAQDPARKEELTKLTEQWQAGWRAENKAPAAKPAPGAGPSDTRAELDFWKMEFQRKQPLPPTLADVPYGDDRLQVLDFWKADTAEPAPLAFFIHGGAWKSHDKNRVSGLHAYLQAGISVVSINYRFLQHAEKAGVEPPVAWPLRAPFTKSIGYRGQSVQLGGSDS